MNLWIRSQNKHRLLKVENSLINKNYIYEYEDRIFLDKDEMKEYLCDIHDGDADNE